MAAEKPINFFQADQLVFDTPTAQLQLEMGEASHSVSYWDSHINNMPHELIVLMEYAWDPSAQQVSAKNLNMRLAVGMLHCVNPKLEIVNGRLFFKTHGYYEIPSLQAPEFFGTPLTLGPMHPDWALYYRLCRPLTMPKNYYETGIGMVNINQGFFSTTNELGFYWKDEIPELFKELSPKISVGGVQDILTLNHQLQHLRDHTQL